MPLKKIRVLVVDDSAIARDMLEKGLSLDPSIEVVGKASDVYAARDRIVFLKPDVITLDIEMPRMDGIEFLRRLLPQYPVAVIVVSSLTGDGSRHALEALDAGAVDIVTKPDGQNRDGFRIMIQELAAKIKTAATADTERIRKLAGAPPVSGTAKKKPVPLQDSEKANIRVIAIGASTGGTVILNKIIPTFPEDTPGIVIVQHMPPVFTRLFAESLNKISQMEVREAQQGDQVHTGLVLIAPGDYHMTVNRYGIEYRIDCKKGDKVSGHRPSVDILFNSVATAAAERAVGVLLTGMGRDGADGLLSMRRAGARCFAQDEESSVVFGMPREAFSNGAAERLVPGDKVTETILSCIDTTGKTRRQV